MTATQRTLLTSIALLSIITGIISYLLSKSIDLCCHVLRGAVITFIVCVILLKE